MAIGFASYSGSDFLGFYVLLLAAAALASWWIPGWLRPDGRRGTDTDAELLAYLGGGPARFADCVLATLIAKGALKVEGKELVPATVNAGETPAERALLRDYKGYGWQEVLRALTHDANAAELHLEKQGLLIPYDERMKLRLYSAAPLLVLAAIGAFRLFAGISEGEPVGLLFALLVVTLGIAVLRLWKFNPRTRAGDIALEEARDAQARLRSAPRQGEVGFAVALFGTSVLMGTPYNGLHDLRQAGGAGGYAGDGGASDSGGDGGCGGGGCGGCGG